MQQWLHLGFGIEVTGLFVEIEVSQPERGKQRAFTQLCIVAWEQHEESRNQCCDNNKQRR